MGLFSGKTKTEQESFSRTTPFIPSHVYDWAGRMHELSQTPTEFFPGQTYAPMQPTQEEALGMREQYARGLGGMVDPSMQAWQSMLTAPDVAQNPYVQGMLGQQADLLTRNLQENLLPSITSGAIGAGQLGSSRQGVAEGIAMRGTQEALANQAAQTQMDAYLAGLGQQRYGLGAAPAMAQFGMMPADVLSGVGAERRAEEQLGISEEMARHQFAQEEPWQRLERFAGAYFPATLPFASTYGRSESTSKSRPSLFQMGTQLAGLGLTGYGMLGGGGGGGYAGSGAVPMPSPGGYGAMPPMYGMGSMTPMMGRYNPMQMPSPFPS